jgi:hypothetical protein
MACRYTGSRTESRAQLKNEKFARDHTWIDYHLSVYIYSFGWNEVIEQNVK